MNSLAVFHSHWRCVADTNLLLFLIGSTDQLDRFCKTVSRVFVFWLNASLRPRGKQKNSKLLCFFRVREENLVAARGDCGVLFMLWWMMRCDVLCAFCNVLCCVLFVLFCVHSVLCCGFCALLYWVFCSVIFVLWCVFVLFVLWYVFVLCWHAFAHAVLCCSVMFCGIFSVFFFCFFLLWCVVRFFVLFCALLFVLWSFFCSVCCYAMFCAALFMFVVLCVYVWFAFFFAFCAVLFCAVLMLCFLWCYRYSVLFSSLFFLIFADELVLPLRLLCWRLGCVIAAASKDRHGLCCCWQRWGHSHSHSHSHSTL